MTNLRPYAASVTLLLALAAGTAAPASAQRRRPQPPTPQAAPWMPITVGMRLGYDDQLSGTVLGGQIHIPVTRNGYVEIVPNGDITFLNSLKEYEFNADVLVSSGGRRGGLYVAAGPAWRNTIFNTRSPTAGRETKVGWSIAVGLKSSPLGRTPFGTQIDVRWVFVDDVIKPRVISFGVNFPLWRPRRTPSGR